MEKFCLCPAERLTNEVSGKRMKIRFLESVAKSMGVSGGYKNADPETKIMIESEARKIFIEIYERES